MSWPGEAPRPEHFNIAAIHMKTRFSSIIAGAAVVACAPAYCAAAEQPSLQLAPPLATQSWVPTQTKALAFAPAIATDAGMMRDDESSLHVTVALKLRNKDVLDNFIKQLKSSTPPAVLTKEEFLERHAPTRGQAVKVVNYLRSLGFQNVGMSDNRLLVRAEGNPGQIKRAFNAELHHFNLAGRLAYANVTDAQIPASLSDSVLAVTGLQTVHQMHTTLQHVAASVSPQAIVSLNPTQFAGIYGASGMATATSATIGIITAGNTSHTIADLKAFASKAGFPEPPVSVITVGDQTNDLSAIEEWNMDTQVSLAAAGGTIRSMLLYSASDLNNDSLLAAWNQVVSDNLAKVINVSLGECEDFSVSDGTQPAGDQIFQAAVAQGQTFSVSSGDSGSGECSSLGSTGQSFPAVSPYVMAIGGTTLSSNGSTWVGETVWSGAGGGMSQFEGAPVWQASAGVLKNSGQRGVPDISFDADPRSGAQVLVTGFNEVIGGTSLAAPLFTGFYSRIQASHGNSLGFPAPDLYAGAAANPSWFHDVTVGSNGGFNAGVGWDYASGYGSLQVQNFASAFKTASTVIADFKCTTSFLVVQCTDNSTDVGGSIGSRAWTFGDGGTSTATNPTHTYASAGTYTIFETVTEAAVAGKTARQSTQNQTVSVAPKPVPSPQLLLNTGFEGGSASWTASAGVVCTPVTCAGETAHAGNGFAWLDGYGTAGTNTLAQTVTIPAGKTSATLSFYLHIDTDETTKTAANDRLMVQVLDASGKLLATLATYSNLNAAAGYVLKTLDVKPYIGQTVKINFTGTENSSLQTSFVLDDITLTAH